MKKAGNDMSTLQSEVLLAGCAQGAVLKLTDPISFWGGVDPVSGKIIHRQHPQYGESVAGKILAMHRSIGSSSGSSILLELFRVGCAPAGIILTEADLVVSLGVVVAKEMGFEKIPVVCIQSSEFAALPEAVTISISGEIGI
jgi:predicted aconitase with swiveling domain